MRDELVKKVLENKKEELHKAFKNRLTYDKWNKQSPVYAYCIFDNLIEKIEDIKRIKFLLQNQQFGVVFFSNEADAKTYLWLRKFIEQEIDNRIAESFNAGYFENFVDVKNITGETYTVV